MTQHAERGTTNSERELHLDEHLYSGSHVSLITGNEGSKTVPPQLKVLSIMPHPNGMPTLEEFRNMPDEELAKKLGRQYSLTPDVRIRYYRT